MSDQTHRYDLLVDLGWSRTFRIRVLAGCHLQHAHAEGVDVHALVVVLLIHLRSHELRSADHLSKKNIYSNVAISTKNTGNLEISLTDFAKLLFLRVARPRSPIFTEPVVPVMNTLSHFRSRWMMGGDLECRKARPLRICRHQDLSTLGLIFLNLLR